MTYLVADNIISSLGFTTPENVMQLRNSRSGIKLNTAQKFLNQSFYVSQIDEQGLQERVSAIHHPEHYTRLEQLLILSALDVKKHTDIDFSAKSTVFIVCTTKGNIDMLEGVYKNKIADERIYLHSMTTAVSTYFNNPNQPIVVSNACISGLLGIIMAKRFIEAGKYEHAVVIGGDLVSKFTVSGFQSFMAISDRPCKPFDSTRNGITIGEAAGTVIVSKHKQDNHSIAITGTATSNDANHISGPSRTGDGLYSAVKNALQQAGNPTIDYISAHGTGTIFNDEMEAKAFTTAGLQQVPLNSLKGYWGHALGASGVIETIATIAAMNNNERYASKGFEKLGVSENINIIEAYTLSKLENSLKTASGFGGCNAAIVLSKLN